MGQEDLSIMFPESIDSKDVSIDQVQENMKMQK